MMKHLGGFHFHKTAGICLAMSALAFDPGIQHEPKQAEPISLDFEVGTLSGKSLSSRSYRGKILIVIYLMAGRDDTRSVVADALSVVKALGRKDIALVFLTPDFIRKAQFAALWAELEIQDPLGFDPGRRFYKQASLIALPTTLVLDRAGRKLRALTYHGTDYTRSLDTILKRSLGILGDADLDDPVRFRELDPEAATRLASRHRLSARECRKKGDLEGAEKELRTALRLAPQDLTLQLDLADLLVQSNRPRAAMMLVDAVLSKEPRHRRAMTIRGIAWLKANAPEKAEAALLEALVLHPDPGRAHYHLGLVYESTGRKDEALDQFKKAAQGVLKSWSEGRSGR